MSWARRKAAGARREGIAKHKQAVRDERDGKPAKGSTSKATGGPVKRPRPR